MSESAVYELQRIVENLEHRISLLKRDLEFRISLLEEKVRELEKELHTVKEL